MRDKLKIGNFVIFDVAPELVETSYGTFNHVPHILGDKAFKLVEKQDNFLLLEQVGEGPKIRFVLSPSNEEYRDKMVKVSKSFATKLAESTSFWEPQSSPLLDLESLFEQISLETESTEEPDEQFES